MTVALVNTLVAVGFWMWLLPIDNADRAVRLRRGAARGALLGLGLVAIHLALGDPPASEHVGLLLVLPSGAVMGALACWPRRKQREPGGS